MRTSQQKEPENNKRRVMKKVSKISFLRSPEINGKTFGQNEEAKRRNGGENQIGGMGERNVLTVASRRSTRRRRNEESAYQA